MKNMVDILRMPAGSWDPSFYGCIQRQNVYVEAADEIERLTAENESLRKDANLWRTHVDLLRKRHTPGGVDELIKAVEFALAKEQS
jgi:hypothetical protein